MRVYYSLYRIGLRTLMPGGSMGLFSRMFSRRASAPTGLPSPVNPATLYSSSPHFHQSDIQLNTTVQACTNAIANAISIMPINLYERKADGSRSKAATHPLHKLLRRAPNGFQSPTLFIATLVRHILQGGNAYVFRAYDTKGNISALRLLNPAAVTRSAAGWPRITYTYNGITYTDQEILHISSLVTDDTGKGFAPADLVRIAVLLGIQLDQYSLSSFGNGINTKLLVDVAEMTKSCANEEEASKIAQVVSNYLAEHYAGADNAGKPLVTWSGMKLTELQHQHSNRDAELLESRKFQEIEICKGFGVPLFLVNNTYDVKYGGLEQAMTVYLNFTLSPYMHHIEQRLATLLDVWDQEKLYFEFDFNVLLRPDAKSRAEFYAKLFAMGAISPGGICKRENMEPPAEGADARFVPANMMPLDDDVLNAYMASAKLKAAALVDGKLSPDPSSATGSQAQ